MSEITKIPHDIYESENEIVVILPLWWVKKESLDIKLEENLLIVNGQRQKPELKDNLVLQKEECYWWEFKVSIALPLTVYFDRIKPVLTKENILIINIPKYVLPKDIKLSVEVLN